MEQAKENPLKWLTSQLITPSFNDSLPSSADIMAEHFQFIQKKKQLKKQNKDQQTLDKKLNELDHGLAQLRAGLADDWKNTVVIIATEFGRTAKESGTLGTDYGTGSALFLSGGAVKGGMVKGSWPGLAEAELFEKRDLMPTTNRFSWIASVLAQHWQFSEQELKQVFPQINAYKNKLIW